MNGGVEAYAEILNGEAHFSGILNHAQQDLFCIAVLKDVCKRFLSNTEQAKSNIGRKLRIEPFGVQGDLQMMIVGILPAQILQGDLKAATLQAGRMKFMRELRAETRSKRTTKSLTANTIGMAPGLRIRRCEDMIELL